MSEYWVANLICSILLAFFLLTLHAVVYRWIFIRPLVTPCPSQWLHELVLNEAGATNWTEFTGSWSKRGVSLGWLDYCLRASSASEALARAEDISRQQESYLQPLLLTCNLSTLFGLLGTVGAFLISDDVNDVAFSTAFRTTAMGILVSIPPALYMALTHNARAHFENQFDMFVEFVQKLATHPGVAQASSSIAASTKVAKAKVQLPAQVTTTANGKPRQTRIEPTRVNESASADYIHVSGYSTGYVVSDSESLARSVLEGDAT